jgi:hypothetical protein
MKTTAERGGAGTADGVDCGVDWGVVAAAGVGWAVDGLPTGPGVRDSTENTATTAATPAASAPTEASSRTAVCMQARIGSGTLVAVPVSDTERIAALLHEASETHHTVFRITDGDDPDWASWYADWLVNLSELPDVLGRAPVRSHLVAALVSLERDYAAAAPAEAWESWYAARLPGLT